MTRKVVSSGRVLSPGRRRTPLDQGAIGRADHFPPFGKAFRNFRSAQGGNSTCDIVSEAGPQDGLEGLLHLGRVAVDAEILVQVSAGAHEDRADAWHRGDRV